MLPNVILKENLRDPTEMIVQAGFLDAFGFSLTEARRRDGLTVNAESWHKLGRSLRESLVPCIAPAHPHLGMFDDYEFLLGNLHNLNTAYLLARDIVKAHLDARITGDRDPLVKLAHRLELRRQWTETHYGGTPSFDVRAMVAESLDDRLTRVRNKQMVDLVQEVCSHGPKAKIPTPLI